jgi:hypothetical protein
MSKTQIPTGGIADDAVENTKLDLTSNYAFTGTITGDNNNLVKISQSSISAGSSVAAIEFSNIFSSTYDTYFVNYSKIRLTAEGGLRMRFYSDTGTTEFSGAYYYWALYGRDVNSADEVNNENGGNQFTLTGTLDYDNPGDSGASGHLYIYNPLANDSLSVIANGQSGYRNNGNVYSANNFSGKYSGTAARYGFKLYGSSGNIELADVTVYGVKT